VKPAHKVGSFFLCSSRSTHLAMFSRYLCGRSTSTSKRRKRRTSCSFAIIASLLFTYSCTRACTEEPLKTGRQLRIGPTKVPTHRIQSIKTYARIHRHVDHVVYVSNHPQILRRLAGQVNNSGVEDDGVLLRGPSSCQAAVSMQKSHRHRHCSLFDGILKSTAH
jgi:hypothetical protein